jgi:uncharacterized membrane protein
VAGGDRPDKRSPHPPQEARLVRKTTDQRREIDRPGVVGVAWSGPIPDPATLAAYERLLPGSAQRIFDRFEMQSDHRMKLETAVIENAERRANRGQWMALTIALAGLALSGVGFFSGHEVGASLVGAGVLADLAGIFIYGRRDQRKEREQKATTLQNP